MGGEADGKLWIGKGEDRKEPKTERSRRRRSSPSCGGGAWTPRTRLRRRRCDSISVGRRTRIRGRKDTTTTISARTWDPRRCPSCDIIPGRGGGARTGARLDSRKSHIARERIILRCTDAHEQRISVILEILREIITKSLLLHNHEKCIILRRRRSNVGRDPRRHRDPRGRPSAMASPAAEIFATIAKEDDAITPEIMERFAHNVETRARGGRRRARGGGFRHGSRHAVREALVVDVRSPGEYARVTSPARSTSRSSRTRNAPRWARASPSKAAARPWCWACARCDPSSTRCCAPSSTSRRPPAANAAPRPPPPPTPPPSPPQSPSTSTVGGGHAVELRHLASPSQRPSRRPRRSRRSRRIQILLAGGSSPGGPRPRRSPAPPPPPRVHHVLHDHLGRSPIRRPLLLLLPPLRAARLRSPRVHRRRPHGRGQARARCSRFARSANRWWTSRASPRTAAPRSGGWVARPRSPPANTSQPRGDGVGGDGVRAEVGVRRGRGTARGKCSVDPGLFQRMRHAPLVVNVVAPEEVRLRTLVQDYAGDAHRNEPGWLEAMSESVGKLHKRLGEKRARAAGAIGGGEFRSRGRGAADVLRRAV